MYNVIIFYEHIVREYAACVNLKKIFSDQGVNAYIFSIAFEWMDAVLLSRKIKIDCLLMPWMYIDENYDLVQPFIKNNSKIKIVNLHHEQIGSPVSQQVLIPHSENAKNQVFHFCWGESFATQLEKNAVSKDLIYITGNIRNDLASKTNYTREYLSQRYNLNPSKKWILFSETRTWVFDKRDLIKKDYMAAGISDIEFEKYRKITKDSLFKTLSEFQELPDCFFDSYEIIYRPHPGQWEPQDINERVKVIRGLSIYDWIQNVDINLTWSSTSIFESDIDNITSILYEPIPHNPKFRPIGIDEYPSVHSFIDLMNIDIKQIKEEEANKKIYLKYLGVVDGNSTNRVVQGVLDIIQKDQHCAKFVGMNWKRYIRQFLYEKCTKIVVRLHILSIIKFPRSAFAEMRDIPYIKENIK